MGLRVNTNVASLNAQRNLFNSSSALGGNFARLSSGLRIATAADDAAGLGISERMRADIRSFNVASRNAQDGISLVQTAEGALNEVSDILGRMRELSMQSANGTLNSDDRATLDTEFQQLVEEIDRISATTQFNGVDLLDGTNTSLSIQVGINGGTNDVISVSGTDATASTLGVSGSISTSSAASTMLGS
ncbi:MAG: flagellin FliC, partial [Planctomycetota bacterium]